MKKTFIKLTLLACIFSGIVLNNPISANNNLKLNLNVLTQVSNSKGDSSFINQAEAFRGNAESFKKILETMKENEVDKNKDEILNIVDSMLDNNSGLQTMIKTKINKASDNESKQFYMRDILPNLQNINRQITRIKLSVKGQINLDNMRKQADRTAESISQVVDRIKKNENK